MALPSDVVYGQDNTETSRLDAGYKWYGGYANGIYANMTALKARFPDAIDVSIAIRSAGSLGADIVDVEPGTLAFDLATSQELALEFVRAWTPRVGGRHRPIVYVMSSWAQDVQNYLAAFGYGRDKIYLYTAHYAGLHLCGPTTCNLINVAADITQYASSYTDWNVARGYVFGPVVPPVVGPPGSLSSGDTGTKVQTLQHNLNRWHPFANDYPILAEDGDFGGHTLAAVRGFEAYASQTLNNYASPELQALLNKTTPVGPPPAFTYNTPWDLSIKTGRTSFRATWKEPDNAAGRAVPYQIYVYESVADRAHMVGTYPRHIPATTKPVFSAQEGSLKRGTHYIVHVVAGEGKQARPWIFDSASFKTS
jgi:hypothetical protein